MTVLALFLANQRALLLLNILVKHSVSNAYVQSLETLISYISLLNCLYILL